MIDAMETGFRNKNRGYQQLRVWQDATQTRKADSILVCFPRISRIPRLPSAVFSCGCASLRCNRSTCSQAARKFFPSVFVSFRAFSWPSSSPSVGSVPSCKIRVHPCPSVVKLRRLRLSAVRSLRLCGLFGKSVLVAALKLVESLERKQGAGDWGDHLIIKESNVAYGPPHHSITPPLHYPTTQHSITPSLHHSISPPS